MGSGTNNRKNSDATFVRVPKSSLPLSTAASHVGGGMASAVCIPSFDVKIEESNLTKVGIKVHLMKKSDLFEIMIGGNTIGKVNKRYSLMIAHCINMGVKYIGEIINKKDLIYARFNRVL
jgi:hypothetical protein